MAGEKNGCRAGIQASGPSLFAPEARMDLTPEEESLKRQIYESMNPRRRKFVDRIGYEEWNPFQAPKDPLDIRKDLSQRTLQELMAAFLAGHPGDRSPEWRDGARQCALGIILKDEKYQGIFDFCLWYHKLLQNEGHLS